MEERSAQFIKGEEKGALYDAYNLLHTLAQGEVKHDHCSLVTESHLRSRTLVN